MAKRDQSFPDPSSFVHENEPEKAFLYAALAASTFKKVIAEVLGWVDQQIQQAQYLEKKEKGEIKDNFEIGGDS